MIKLSFMEILYRDNMYVFREGENKSEFLLYTDEVIALSKVFSALVQAISKQEQFVISLSFKQVKEALVSYKTTEQPLLLLVSNDGSRFSKRFTFQEVGVFTSLLEKLSTFSVVIPFLDLTIEITPGSQSNDNKTKQMLDPMLSPTPDPITKQEDDFPFDFEEPKTKPGDPHPRTKEIVDDNQSKIQEANQNASQQLQNMDYDSEEIESIKTTVLSLLALREDQVSQESTQEVNRIFRNVMKIDDFTITEAVLRDYISSIRTTVNEITKEDKLPTNPVSENSKTKYQLIKVFSEMFDNATTKEQKLQLYPVLMFFEHVIGLYEATKILNFNQM